MSFAGEWAAATVGTPGEFSAFHQSMAMDNDGNLHVAYYQGWSHDAIRYATNASGVWQALSIDGRGYKTAIAVDENNGVHLVYFFNDNENSLKYATNASGSWTLQTIDATGNFDSSYESSTAVAIDAAGKVHVCYYHALATPLKYASNVSGTWETQIVDGNGKSGDVSIDSGDNIYIVYNKTTGGKLSQATNMTGNWVSSELDLTGGEPKIAIDSSDNLHVAYISGGGLCYANNASGSWAKHDIDIESRAPAIALDSSDNAHICYSGGDSIWSTKYATNAGGAWLAKKIDPYEGLPDYFIKTYYRLGQFGTNNAISIDTDGNAHVTYPAWLDMTQNILRYATNKAPIFDLSGEWKISITENWAACDPGQDANMALTVEQTGNAVKAVNTDMAENPVVFRGKTAGSVYELVAEFPEGNGSTLMIVSLMAASHTFAKGPQFWLYRESPSYCYGGSSVEYRRSSPGSPGGGSGGGCFITTMPD